MIPKDFDVAKNLQMTEELQCLVLQKVSDLYSSMNKKESKSEQTEILAELEVTMYLLALKLGISKDSLDKKAILKVKANIAKEERAEWKTALLDTLTAMKGDVD